MITGFLGKPSKNPDQIARVGLKFFPTPELMTLPSTIDLEIPVPPPDGKRILHAVAARDSTTDKVPGFWKCKDKRSWSSAPRYACIKAEVECGVAYHGGEGLSQSDCPNIAAPHLRSQKGLQVRDRDKQG